jgi:hypothetical protein
MKQIARYLTRHLPLLFIAIASSLLLVVSKILSDE